MRWPFVTRARYVDLYERYQTALKVTADARAEREAFRTAATISARQYAEADAANLRLEGRLLELGRRLARLAESDPEYAAALERRVARLRTVGKRALAAYARERQRADRLASHLDDGDLKAIARWELHVKAHDAWRPPTDRDKWPPDGASGRPLHPAVALLRAMDRCRALEATLADVEGRKRGVSS